MINIRNLNKYYHKGKSNEIHVINNTSITLEDTGLVCILGESGSGKTTLMNTISGLDDFHDGEIEVDGIVVQKFGDKNQEYVRNEKFGYIFQNYYLLQDRSVEYNLMLALSLYDIPDEAKRERIDYVLRSVDMWKYKKRKVSQLSGGQQQRIAIARALAKSPKVIFADEPTGNLDEANTMRVMSILKKISETCLVVVVTHERSIADFFADEIWWIEDGTIKNSEKRKSSGSYEYVEDTNLYLKEYHKSEVEQDGVKLEVYGNEDIPKLKFKVICEHGKIYLHTEDDTELVFLSNADEKKMIDSHKPVVEESDLENIDFDLEHIAGAKRPKMTAREIMEIAKNNIAVMGKKQIFLMLSLFAVAVLIVLTVKDLTNILHVDTKTIVTTDTRYYKVSAEKDKMITDKEFNSYFVDMTTSLLDSDYELQVAPVTSLTYQYHGYEQLESGNYAFKQYFLADIDKLDESSLIYGTMPEDDYEIVVDRWVLENMMESSSQVENAMKNVESAIGSVVVTDRLLELEIVGICETEQPDIYMDADVLLMLCHGRFTFLTESKAEDVFAGYSLEKLPVSEDGVLQVYVADNVLKERYESDMIAKYGGLEEIYNTLESLKNTKEHDENMGGDDWRPHWGPSIDEQIAEYEKIYAEKVESCGLTYEEYQELMLENDYKNYSYTGIMTEGIKYQVVGSFPEGYDIDYIIADEACPQLKKSVIDSLRSFYIYSDSSKNAEQIKESVIDSIPAEISENLNIKVENEYYDIVEQYTQERNQKIATRILMTITILAISMVILYFMMKANAVSRMGDLGVYRMLGISKWSIIGMFAYENFVITTYTSLTGAVLTVCVTYIIAQIPSMGQEFYFPWYIFVLTMIGIYIMNIFIGVLPIRKMLKLPPAQLAAKYDI